MQYLHRLLQYFKNSIPYSNTIVQLIINLLSSDLPSCTSKYTSIVKTVIDQLNHHISLITDHFDCLFEFYIMEDEVTFLNALVQTHEVVQFS